MMDVCGKGRWWITRPSLWPALLAALAGSVTAATAPRLTSVPVPDPIVVDGELADWDGIPVEYLRGSVGVIGSAHDSGRLYLMFRFKQPRLAQRILSRGVTLWINGNAKEKQVYGIRYTGSHEIVRVLDEQQHGDTSGVGDPSSERLARETPLGRVQKPATLTVFDRNDEYVLPQHNLIGPSAASTAHDDLFCYEFSIPIEDVGGKVAKKPIHPPRNLKLGVQLGGLTEEERQQMMDLFRDFRGGGDYRGGGGGVGGGPGGGGTGRGGSRTPDADNGERLKNLLAGEVVWLDVLLQPEG